MEFISERVSFERKPDGLSVVITARLERGKEALLIGWTAAWLFCGGYFIYALTQAPSHELHQALLAMLAFWTYFVIRIGRVLLFRLKGFELWRVKDGEFSIKESLFGYGKANVYFVENITDFGLLHINELSIKYQLGDSFWTRGVERLGFMHLGKKVAIGRGLTRAEAIRLEQLLSTQFKRVRKAVQ